MESGDNLSTMKCRFCGEVFRLPEDDSEGNLPRVLVCAHIFCTTCLLTFHQRGVIRCPECEVESTLPEGGVFALQEDSRIIGLIYTSKMNKMKRADGSLNRKKQKLTPTKDVGGDAEARVQVDVVEIKKSVDEALARAAENLAVLDTIHETLTVGLKQQVRREGSRLEAEIKQTADKALQAVQKWQDVQLSQLEARFSSSQEEVDRVQKRRKALEIAMQIARQVRSVPFLEQYCSLDKVVETLEAPVDKESYDMESITTGSGLSFVFLSENLNQTLMLSLKMEVGVPKQLFKCPPPSLQQSSSEKKPPRPSPKVTRTDAASPQPESPEARGSYSASGGALNVVPEELPARRQEKAAPPTGPQLASDWRIHRRKKNVQFGNKRNVAQWVVLSHVVNPSHFYVSYVAEKREREILEKKMELFCCADGCLFGPSDTVETGAMVFAKGGAGLWSRARVLEVFQSGRVEAARVCPAGRLARIRLFFLDSGFGKSLDVHTEEETPESSLKAVNDHLRKVEEGVKVELGHFAPQAIRCSLKDLVPYDPTKGWSSEAKLEFLSVVGSAAVEMRPMGQDRDSLLVDLRKAPMDQSSDVPISVREYLVFIEVARFYSPVNLGMWPLLFHPPKYPQINTELSAVVSHVNSPADFYIQLVDNMEFVLLSSKLQDCYNATTARAEEDLTIYCPVMEQACVARYEDKLWYRARVVGHPGGRKVEVQYVDFGNKKTLPVSDLRKIKDEFFALPSRAIRCCLSGVSPLDAETWSDACRIRFIQLALQKLLTVVATGNVPKTEPLPVKLNGPLGNVAELLVREELASFKEGLESAGAAEEFAVWDPPLDLGSAPEGGNAPDRSSSEEKEEEEGAFQLRLPDQLKDLKVRVSHVNSPSSFYVQFAQNDSCLRRLCELVEEECALMEPEEVVWEADMFCGALVDGVWERGRVCSDATDLIEVMRCDHGNKVKLPVGNLRPLPSFLTGSLALECTLSDIRPAGGCSTWTATACDLISFYLTGALAVLTIKEVTDEPPVPVSLFCSNQKGALVNFTDFLVGEGLALKERKPRDAAVETSTETDVVKLIETQKDGSDGKKRIEQTPSAHSAPAVPPSPPPVSTPKPAPRTIMSAEKVKTGLYRPPELPGLGPIQMSVSAIGEDGVIYTRTQNAEGLLQQLRQRIQHSMDSLPRQKPYTWRSVQGCAVIGPDMLWYRGQLLEVLGGHVKVQYVDYGLVENIPVVHVHPTLLCADVPQLCLPCQLHGITPVGGRWQRDAVTLLRELLLNRCTDLRVTALPSDPRQPLTVELYLDGLSLSSILCHHQHASMEPQEGHADPSPAVLPDDWDIDIKNLRGPEEPMLGPFIHPDLPLGGERFGVRVKHLRTPNEMFLWPSDGAAEEEIDGETLDGALTRVNADVGALQPLTSFRQGGPCLAEYRDGKFYRAKMLMFSSVSPVCVLVQHVDFGSEDTLPTSRLRQMPADLLRFPLRALQVKVAGFKSPRASGREDMLPYSPGWSVEATMEMMNLLHGSITADIVAVEPELTMLLYDEDQQLVHLPLVSRGLVDLDLD